jgi:tetratricopeptide (TPR) repeat protein
MEPERALAVLEQARPLLEARGTPARKTAFYRFYTLQKLLRTRLRVDDDDIASLRASIAFAERTGEDKDVGYSIDFLGWALWLRGDLAEAAEELTKALALGERIGETLLRNVAVLTLTLTALRRHDVQAVRDLLPQAFAAAKEVGGDIGSRVAGSLAAAAWLAWQDGRPDEVLRLAAEIEERNLRRLGTGVMYRWVYLFPLLAVHLQAGETGEAVAAARRIIDPSQQVLPDDLTAALAAACESWDQGSDRAQTEPRLREALAVARDRAYF